MAATARVTILMEPAEKLALEARARREKVSVGEVVRRALLAPQSVTGTGGRTREDFKRMATVCQRLEELADKLEKNPKRG